MAKKLTVKTRMSMRGQTDLLTGLMVPLNVRNIGSVRRILRENRPDGPLTKVTALSIISDALGVPVENLLEDALSKKELENVLKSAKVGIVK